MVALALPTAAHAQHEPRHDSTLRIATVNLWSGLDYVGVTSMGEWETPARRGERFALLVQELRRVDPDIVVVQEASPIVHLASALADSLGYDEIHQVVNAGLKIGSLGMPSNLKEGVAIVARRSLRLVEARTWKLSGSIGIHGDLLTIHPDESVFALAALVRIGDHPIHIVNVHLSATPPDDDSLRRALQRERDAGAITPIEMNDGLSALVRTEGRRREEIARLISHLEELDSRIPVVIAGDFNTTIESRELAPLIDSLQYRSALDSITAARPTWDPAANTNVAYSARLTDAATKRLAADGLVSAIYDRRARAIDHILMSPHFGAAASAGSDLFLDDPARDAAGAPLHASDHYGVLTDIRLDAISSDALLMSDETIDAGESVIDALPIATYDTDVGFGYGAKGYLRNIAGVAESFDITLFNSTEGERWYRLVVSWPDAELRHRKLYPIALDLEVDYDKWIASSYFGIGNESRFGNRRYFTREPIDIAVTASRGLSPVVVAQVGARYRTVRNYDLRDSALWSPGDVSVVSGRQSWGALFAAVRLDSRNSTVDPTRGSLLQLDVEAALPGVGSASFTKVGAAVQSFLRLWYPTTVLALRFAARGIIGPDVPLHALLSLGGNNTLRGSPQDRYVDRIVAVGNAELRFPILWRFGGVIGYDAGKVWDGPADIDLGDWPGNTVVGLRFAMETFVARLDVGFGSETTGLYFNFGHAF